MVPKHVIFDLLEHDNAAAQNAGGAFGVQPPVGAGYRIRGAADLQPAVDRLSFAADCRRKL